jgi:hypothetical protein
LSGLSPVILSGLADKNRDEFPRGASRWLPLVEVSALLRCIYCALDCPLAHMRTLGEVYVAGLRGECLFIETASNGVHDLEERAGHFRIVVYLVEKLTSTGTEGFHSAAMIFLRLHLRGRCARSRTTRAMSSISRRPVS